jgi:hypothetical protein
MNDTPASNPEPDTAAMEGGSQPVEAAAQTLPVLGIADDPKLADAIVERLNALINYDPDVRRDIASLLLMRVQVFHHTANHPTIQVGQESDCMPATLGVLGLLNGLCGTIKPMLSTDLEDNAETVERVQQAFPGSTVRQSVSDEHGLTNSTEFAGWGFIASVWEEGQLVRFQRVGAKHKVPGGLPFGESLVHSCNVTLNGHSISVMPGFERFTYDDIVERMMFFNNLGVQDLAAPPPGVVTVTFKHAASEPHEGTLTAGGVITVQEGTIISATRTDGA